ncbi:uncharacterized protein F4807DRAFT_443459 [Annulohypoxylon truncatum]|uniref:uncharacterized protein n=1 Tax=Annulohypoxylon truncatum TaxID=327061 RepID=UPI002007CF19|nr:uncharacterized protein F4807DRAFT_443459 [Annulohypoxylon truncatum]KAI1205285.1 hypothetical protein F4807DRAFT_443459 [Annulohypoxylon truncatum]
MAEAFGVVASGIAVAQVAGTAAGAVIKLKRLWEEVKNVPENIADLMEQIDCLDPALWEAEQHFIQNQLPPQLWDDTAAVRSAKYCRKALQNLTDVAEDLASQVNSKKKVERGISRVKVILKKGCLHNLERRLGTAVRMLESAQLGYIVTLVKLQPDIVACKVVSHLENMRRPNSLIGTDLEINDKEAERRRSSADPKPRGIDDERIPRKRELTAWRKSSAFGYVDFTSTQGGFVVDTRPPWWLSGMLRAWSFNVAKSYSSWKFHIRSYSIRPEESLIFDAAGRDDVQALQAMFDSGEASPFDRRPDGIGILRVATIYRSLKVLRLLKDMCLDIDFPDYHNRTANATTPWNDAVDSKKLSEFAWLMTSRLYVARDFEDCRDRCRCILMSDVETFQKLRAITCPAHDMTPLSTRLWQARNFVMVVSPLKFEVFRQILSPDLNEDLAAVCGFECNGWPSLIHITAMAISGLDIPLNEPQQWLGDEIESWIDFTRSVVQRSNLHLDTIQWLRDVWGGQHWVPLTPLVYMILWRPFTIRVTHIRRGQFENIVRTGLRRWLLILKRTGRDLIEYGREETRMLLTSRFESRTICYPKYLLGDPSFVYNLISFQFGPNVDDWNILWNEPTDEFAGDFWNLIEGPIIHIPGAWYDSDIEAE